MYACSLILLVFILAAELHIIQSLEVGGGEVGFSAHNYVSSMYTVLTIIMTLFLCLSKVFVQKLLIQKLQILLEISIILEQSRTTLGCITQNDTLDPLD